MFDLDSAIAAWRRQLAAGGVKSAEVLDELESHLRDEIEQQELAEVGGQRAFEFAVQQIGQAAALEGEFAKIGVRTRAQMRNAVFALAGIPNEYVNEPMNTSNIEPRWATYLKATAFAAPAICLWIGSVFLVVPKIQQICAEAGGYHLPGFLSVMLSLTENAIYICGAMILLVGLLEWRSSKWPRYRRMTVGIGTFALNTAILVSIFALVVVALTYAPALFRHG
jgi:hypothetical protein